MNEIKPTGIRAINIELWKDPSLLDYQIKIILEPTFEYLLWSMARNRIIASTLPIHDDAPEKIVARLKDNWGKYGKP